MKHNKERFYGIWKKLLLFGILWSITLLLFICFQWCMDREEAELLKDTGMGVYELKVSEKDMLFIQKLESLRKDEKIIIGESRQLEEEELMLEEAALAEEIDALLAEQYKPLTEALCMGKAKSRGGYTSINCEVQGKRAVWTFAAVSFVIPDMENLEGIVMYDYDTKHILGLSMSSASFVNEIWNTPYAEETLLWAIQDYYEGMSVDWDNQEINSSGTKISVWEEYLTDDELLLQLVYRSLGIAEAEPDGK